MYISSIQTLGSFQYSKPGNVLFFVIICLGELLEDFWDTCKHEVHRWTEATKSFLAECDRTDPAGNTELQASTALTHIRTWCIANGRAITELSTAETQQAGFHLHGRAAFQMLDKHTNTAVCVITGVMSTSALCLVNGLRL